MTAAKVKTAARKKATKTSAAKKAVPKRTEPAGIPDQSKRSDWNLEKLRKVAKGFPNYIGDAREGNDGYGILFRDGPIETIVTMRFKERTDPRQVSSWQMKYEVWIPGERTPYELFNNGIISKGVQVALKKASEDVRHAYSIYLKREAEAAVRKPAAKKAEKPAPAADISVRTLSSWARSTKCSSHVTKDRLFAEPGSPYMYSVELSSGSRWVVLRLKQAEGSAGRWSLSKTHYSLSGETKNTTRTVSTREIRGAIEAAAAEIRK